MPDLAHVVVTSRPDVTNSGSDYLKLGAKRPPPGQSRFFLDLEAPRPMAFRTWPPSRRWLAGETHTGTSPVQRRPAAGKPGRRATA